MAKFRINVIEVLEDGTEQSVYSGPAALGQDFEGRAILTYGKSGAPEACIAAILNMTALELMASIASDSTFAAAAATATDFLRWKKEVKPDAAD